MSNRALIRLKIRQEHYAGLEAIASSQHTPIRQYVRETVEAVASEQ